MNDDCAYLVAAVFDGGSLKAILQPFGRERTYLLDEAADRLFGVDGAADG